jgi:hypothetical protein
VPETAKSPEMSDSATENVHFSRFVAKETASPRTKSDIYSEVYHKNMVLITDGFNFETVLDDVQSVVTFRKDEEVITAQWISKYFLNDTNTIHFLSNDDKNPMVITAVKEMDSHDRINKVRAVISTPSKDEPVLVLGSQLPSKSKKVSDRKLLSYIKPDLIGKHFRKIKSTPNLLAGFLAMAKIKLEFLHLDKKFKVGVIYYKGQKTEDDIFNQRETSPAFETFLEILGNKIELKGFKGYSGGLDTKKNKDGNYALYTWHNGAEIIYHVTSLLECDAIQKKVHIGNNAVNIVFVDSDQPFSPTYINSKFNQVWIVVSLEENAAVIQKVNQRMASPRYRSTTRSVEVSNSSVAPLKREMFTLESSDSKNDNLRSIETTQSLSDNQLQIQIAPAKHTHTNSDSARENENAVPYNIRRSYSMKILGPSQSREALLGNTALPAVPVNADSQKPSLTSAEPPPPPPHIPPPPPPLVSEWRNVSSDTIRPSLEPNVSSSSPAPFSPPICHSPSTTPTDSQTSTECSLSAPSVAVSPTFIDSSATSVIPPPPMHLPPPPLLSSSCVTLSSPLSVTTSNEPHPTSLPYERGLDTATNTRSSSSSPSIEPSISTTNQSHFEDNEKKGTNETVTTPPPPTPPPPPPTPPTPTPTPPTSPTTTTTTQTETHHKITLQNREIFYRVCVVRREGVPAFGPKLPWPYPVFRHSIEFRNFLLDKVIGAAIAAYSSPTFKERILHNRKLFLDQFMHSIEKTEAV